MIRSFLLICCCISTAMAAPVPLNDGDRVVLLGDTFFEREGNHGYIESAIVAAHPGKTLRFRNLAWSGDTPNAQARSYFGPPTEGQQRLKGNLELVKPTVVFACYGAAVAAEGEAGLKRFIDDYNKLLDLIGQSTQSKVVLVSPPAAEAKGTVKPFMDVRNVQLKQVGAAVKALAEARKLEFIDLYSPVAALLEKSDKPLTMNGLHFTEAGYKVVAPVIASTLVALPKSGAVVSEKLRATVMEKNMLFFNRYRPQNEIYLFGSRKHEQGNNGAEIPVFDPLVDAKDKEIAAIVTQPSS